MTSGTPQAAAATATPQVTHEAAPSGVVAEALARADADGLELVRFLYVDHGGIIRGKAAAGSSSRSASRAASATPWR